MKRIGFVILAMLLSINVFAKANKQVVVFNVMMHCHDCVEKIEKGLAYEPGIINLKPDLKTNSVEVTYNASKTDVKIISAAFKKIGYLAFPVGENCSTKKGGCLNNPATQMNTMK